MFVPFMFAGIVLICGGVFLLVSKNAYKKSHSWNMLVEALNMSENVQVTLRVIMGVLPILIGSYFLLNGALYPGKVLWLMQQMGM